MSFSATLLIYLVIGLVVASANLLLSARAPRLERVLAFTAAVPFWPIFAPFLIARPRVSRSGSTDGGLETRIEAAVARLIEALGSLDGIADDVLGPEVERVTGLGRALRTMARRSAEMSALLATPELSKPRALQSLAALEETSPANPRAASIRARIANIERLESMQARTLEALERALLEAEEIGTRMALLRFADRPEDEVVRMIRDIAASVEGVSESLALE